ncbi:ATP-NAD kinase-like domain-containing protein [Annulohypoxylon maeteangense]|uniref:ATP-NAD kinase-like domain-containing protein n=1 Tax=Annulohypoxylon maeteangense TaxID=1927788 RepID=UPI0020080385|nr:ATP-NAD kinase-like domain-containing protein [Annulohypoxylon maeteangense]KAI0883005.1 ATP-NAD kinase-like domain-containing protein [Annulohypoxylon maeteangense]
MLDSTPAFQSTVVDNVLLLPHNVSLALTNENLIINDKSQAKLHRQKLCGFAVGRAPSGVVISLYHVLWVEITPSGLLVIDYADPVSKKHLRAAKLSYALGEFVRDVVDTWVNLILKRAYGTAQRNRRAKVLVNPHAGPGGADKIWEHEVKPLLEAARMSLDIVRTKFSGEAIGICENLDVDAYDIVIPCSGDGLPYECINGLGKRSDARKALRRIAVAHIPCGSGNAMSCNLNGTHRPSYAALAIVKGVSTPIDLMSVTQGNTRMLSFLSQSVGIIAECDLGTENLRWLGAARFNVGLMQRIFSKRVYPCDISMKVEIAEKADIKAHYKREQTEGDYTTRREVDVPREASSAGEYTSSDTDTGEGLPPLRFGTINDKLPDDWETASYDKLGNFYCGNMAWMAPDANFFTAACPNDGLMDVVLNDGDISAAKYLELLTSVETGRLFDNPHVSYRKVAAYRFTPRNQKDGYISIDGEHVPFEPFQVEIHQGLGTVLSKSGKYEAAGPSDWEKASV